MKYFAFKSREEVIRHLRDVKQRKREWQEKAVAEYQALMKETQKERERINAAVVD